MLYWMLIVVLTVFNEGREIESFSNALGGNQLMRGTGMGLGS